MRKMRCGWSSCWLPLLVWILVLTLLLAYFIQDIWREYVPLCTLLSWHKFFAKDVLGRFSQAAASWLLFSECQWNSILKFPPPIIARREEVNKKHPRYGLSRAMILGRWHLSESGGHAPWGQISLPSSFENKWTKSSQKFSIILFSLWTLISIPLPPWDSIIQFIFLPYCLSMIVILYLSETKICT